MNPDQALFMFVRSFGVLVVVLAAWCAAPAVAESDWLTVAYNDERRVELDRKGVIHSDSGTRVAWARMLLGKAEAAELGYAAVFALNRYDCRNRTFVPVRRRYLDDRNIVVREEEIADRTPRELSQAGVDERLWREICQPPSHEALTQIARVAERRSGVQDRAENTSSEARDKTSLARTASVKTTAKRNASPSPQPASPQPTSPQPAPEKAPEPAVPPLNAPSSKTTEEPAVLPEWSYEGLTGPVMWGRLRPEWAVCGEGKRQSPIALDSALIVGLEPVRFDYRPIPVRVFDTGRVLRVLPGEKLTAQIRGERFELTYIEVHRPGEERVDGRIHDLSVDLHHRAADGRFAVVSIQFSASDHSHPVIDAWLAALPLERGDTHAPTVRVDLRALLPSEPGYILYSGSLTSPPCTEGVLRVIMRQAQELSHAQLAVIAHLHPPNARPLQSLEGRRLLGSR